MFRSVLSVLLGLLLMGILPGVYVVGLAYLFPGEFLSPEAEEALNDAYYVIAEPTPIMQGVILVCDFATAVFGGYFTAAIAIVNPKKHAAALAMLIGVLGVVSLVSMYGNEPLPYAAARTLGAPLLVYAGGVLRTRFPRPAEMSHD